MTLKMHSTRKIARLFLLLILLGAGVAFTIRLLGSTSAELANSRALITSGGVIGLAFIFIVCLGFEKDSLQRNAPEVRTAVLSLSVVVLVFACYLPVLGTPLLHDSYTHVYLAANGSWRALLDSFITHPVAGDFFFRPVGYATFLIDSHWAGMSPLRWHLLNLFIHALNAVLVLLLAKRLSFNSFASMTAAAVFAIHGSRPEAVAWVAARFDLLACLFSLLSLLTLQKYVKFRRFGWGRSHAFVGALCRGGLTLLWALCAVLSKESAYCLPLVMLVLAFFYGQQDRKHVYRLALLCGALILALLMYRFWLLGGPGGYHTQSGAFAILRFNFLRTINALFFREWSLLFFPVNWSTNVGPLLKSAALGSILLIACLAIFIKAPRLRLTASLMMVVAASLPVQHLLLIGPDLNGARVLYLPLLGFCLFWASLCEVRSSLLAGGLLVIGIVAAQVVYLDHNLRIWKDVAFLSKHACESFGRELGTNNRPAIVTDLPHKRDGVFFLSNGFSQCVALNSGIAAGNVHVIEGAPVPSQKGTRVFKWDDSTASFVPVSRK